MKNYGDGGVCYPSRPQPQFKNIAKTCLPPSMQSMLSSSSKVDVQGCSAPQIFSKQQMSPFELSSCCPCHALNYYFAQFLLFETNEMSAFFVFTTKTTQPRVQVFSINGALAHLAQMAYIREYPHLPPGLAKTIALNF